MSSDTKYGDLAKNLDEHGSADGLKYGTAGFRADAALLPAAMYRLGVLAAFRSRAVDGGAIGVMITASHNKEPYNGAKLMDTDGSMLAAEWELLAGKFVNIPQGKQALQSIGELLLDSKYNVPATVIIARDTRRSSPELSKLVETGVKDAGGTVIDLGVATTPQIHSVIRARHRKEPDTIEAYYEHINANFNYPADSTLPGTANTIVVDCANGVGSISMNRLLPLLPNMILVNYIPGEEYPLNETCGADYVQKSKVAPKVYNATMDGKTALDVEKVPTHSTLWASLDGDADRLVVYLRDEDDNFILADGDRFAVLCAQQISSYLRKESNMPNDVKIGVALTAYSNGAATNFLNMLPNVDVILSKSGVKHLEVAIEKYDVGIYWEPNGHGTVLYSDKFRDTVACKDPYLAMLGNLANQSVGDGVMDLFLILAIMNEQNMSYKDWMGQYTELYTVNSVLRVQDRSVIETENFDTKVVRPVELRDEIEKQVNALGGKTNNVRAFVRPSGTEDVVRIFAEAEDKDTAERLERKLKEAVFDICGGVGERP